jgi:hypothetical protein
MSLYDSRVWNIVIRTRAFRLPRGHGGRRLASQCRIGRIHRHPWSDFDVATVLDKQLKRQVTVGGVEYTVAVDPEGLRLTGKGKRKPEVELRWADLLSGEAAMAVALNASLSQRQAVAAPATQPAPPARRGRRTPKKQSPS